MSAVTDLLAKWEVQLPLDHDVWTNSTYRLSRCLNELRAAIAADISATASAEQIVRALAVVKRGSEQAHDLAGEAVMWVVKNGD